jgi:hypothetical protein
VAIGSRVLGVAAAEEVVAGADPGRNIRGGKMS